MSDCSVVSSLSLPITWCVWSTQPVAVMKYQKNSRKASALTMPASSGTATVRRAIRLNWLASMAALAGMGLLLAEVDRASAMIGEPVSAAEPIDAGAAVRRRPPGIRRAKHAREDVAARAPPHGAAA